VFCSLKLARFLLTVSEIWTNFSVLAIQRALCMIGVFLSTVLVLVPRNNENEVATSF
jgi:hypothetical protein